MTERTETDGRALWGQVYYTLLAVGMRRSLVAEAAVDGAAVTLLASHALPDETLLAFDA